jgi:Cellobiose phosphorylase
MVSAAGGGFTRFGDVAVNRWRNDGTTDDYGQWCYLKDVDSGRIWSAGYQPVCAGADAYRAILGNDCVTIARRDGALETVTTIAVDSKARTDARRVVVSNHSDTKVTVELTSYQEIAIARTCLTAGTGLSAIFLFRPNGARRRDRSSRCAARARR